jgi:transposase InsO family protein
MGHHPTVRVHELWQTDYTYFRLSAGDGITSLRILDDYSWYIIGRKLYTTVDTTDVRLQNYYLPWELEQEIARFSEYYNNQRYHDSLDNVTPADVYYGRQHEIIARREQLKQRTLRARKRYKLSQPIA